MIRERNGINSLMEGSFRIICAYCIPACRFGQINHLIRAIVHLHINRTLVTGDIRYPDQICTICRYSNIRKLQ